MDVPQNVTAICLTCGLTFVSGMDSIINGEAKCPACGEKTIAERAPSMDQPPGA